MFFASGENKPSATTDREHTLLKPDMEVLKEWLYNCLKNEKFCMCTDTAATFNENLYKSNSRGKTGLHTKRARLTQVVYTAPVVALTSKNFLPQNLKQAGKHPEITFVCV